MLLLATALGCALLPTPAVSRVRGDAPQLAEAADLFVDAFWSRETSTAAQAALSDGARRELVAQQVADMESRYGTRVGARRLPSQLLLARSPAGAAVGCVGVEAALVDPIGERVLTRQQGEARIVDLFQSMGARERNQYRKLPLLQLTAELLPEFKVFGLLANLAVAPSARRAGLAQKLCRACEGVCQEWGLPALLLQVEQENQAARRLYSRIGYGEVWRDGAAAALRLRPGAGGDGGPLFQDVDATLISMAKAADGDAR
jgi:ribosomal protein S18 acetylase RimI-like enzyme